MKKFISNLKKVFGIPFKQKKRIKYKLSYAENSKDIYFWNVYAIPKLNYIQLHSGKAESVLELQKEDAIELIRQLKIEIKKINK